MHKGSVALHADWNWASLCDLPDLAPGISYAAAPRNDAVLAEIQKYRVCEIASAEDSSEYAEFLRSEFNAVGIYRDEFLPSDASTCYKVAIDTELVAIFRLTPAEESSIFHRVIPGVAGKEVLEVNNVAVARSFRGDLLLGFILNSCALLSYWHGYDIVAGIVRYDVLPLFIDYGTIPVRHEPLHLLGDVDICDYVTYFRTDKPEYIRYAVARSYHYFHRKVVMKKIAGDVTVTTPQITGEA